jgi:Probable Zinc-ribbon domain
MTKKGSSSSQESSGLPHMDFDSGGRSHPRWRSEPCPDCDAGSLGHSPSGRTLIARGASGKARNTPRPGGSLAEKFPEVAADWHPARNGDLTPSDVGYASNKKVWWQCHVCHHE